MFRIKTISLADNGDAEETIKLINPQQVVSIDIEREIRSYTIKMKDGNIIKKIDEIEEGEFDKLYWYGGKQITEYQDEIIR